MAWVVDFLNEVDVMYAHPGRADNVYIYIFVPSIPVVDFKRVTITRFFKVCNFFLGNAHFFSTV